MNKIENYKSKKINGILAIVHLASLLFVGVIILQNVFKSINVYSLNTNSNYPAIYMIITVIMLLVIYMSFKYFIESRVNDNNRNIVILLETIIFIIIFTISIVISGGNQSECKFIFLFLIITSTIEGGLKKGIEIALISSFIILCIDLIYMPNTVVNNYFETDLILAGIFILTAWTLGYYVKIEKAYIKNLEDLVNRDGLTGVYNHRYFHEALHRIIKEADKKKEEVSVLFLDIDYFKHYNDLYGHQEGDIALKKIGKILNITSKDKHVVARYGGEEFSIILPNTSLKEGEIIAEKIRYSVEKAKFFGQENQPNGNLTVSIGVASYPEKANSDMELIKAADDALYRAKFFSKNRVESYVSILDEIKKDIEEKDIELVASIKILISVINAKDKYTYGHSERVVFYSRLLGSALSLNEKDKKNLIYAAYLHDIGKINISKELLIKKMPLTCNEWDALKTHPQNGADIIEPIEGLKEVMPVILHHHERYDGEGYPYGLKGEEIPFLARVLTVVDSFDAMTSNRPYNERKSHEEGLIELNKCKGKQFDPEIVKVFTKVIRENSSNLG